MRCTARLADGTPIEITSTQDAWREGRTELSVMAPPDRSFTLLVRIPAWAGGAQAQLNGTQLPQVSSGDYLKLDRCWTSSDRLTLTLPLTLRAAAGANEASGKVSIYYGPLLLTYDQAEDRFDETALPRIDLERLDQAQRRMPSPQGRPYSDRFCPWVIISVPTVDGQRLNLVDFASAGAKGTRYVSWLAADPVRPEPAFTVAPADGGRVALGPVRFQWRAPRRQGRRYRVEISTQERVGGPLGWSTNVEGTSLVLDTRQLATLAGEAGARLWWRVVAAQDLSESVADVPPAWFRLDPQAPVAPIPPVPKLGPGEELVRDSLREQAAPQWGELQSARITSRDSEGAELNGEDQMLVYVVPAWPEEDFTVHVRVRIKAMPEKRIGQVFSAWSASMDDPLRLVVDGGKLFARIEAGSGYSTPGVPVETNRWYSMAALKRSGQLTLFLDGKEVGHVKAPLFNRTQAQDCALGGNPHFGGRECLAARFADFGFWARALSIEELGALARQAP